MISIPTAVYYDSSYRGWVVEYGSTDRQEHFGHGILAEERARDRAAAMGLPRDLQITIPPPVDLTGQAFTDRDWE